MSTLDPIDAVFTWVREPSSAAESQSLRATCGGSEESTAMLRFRNTHTFRFALRSIEAMAPWIRQIWVVTNGERPCWLRHRHPRVTIVAHSSLWPVGTASRDLPTFNSLAIETHIHRIAGLAERFIYFNDDMLLGRPLRPHDVFDSATGLPLIPRDASWGPTRANRTLSELPDLTCSAAFAAAPLQQRCLAKADAEAVLAAGKLARGPRGVRPLTHAPMPARRSFIAAVQRQWPAFFDDLSRSRCRTARTVALYPSRVGELRPPFWVYAWYGIAARRYAFGATAVAFLSRTTAPRLRPDKRGSVGAWLDAQQALRPHFLILNDDTRPDDGRARAPPFLTLLQAGLEAYYGYELGSAEDYDGCAVLTDEEVPTRGINATALLASALPVETQNSLIRATLGAMEVGHVGARRGSAGVGAATLRFGDLLRVVVFTAERGRHWRRQCAILRGHAALANASLVLLNELDEGMARTERNANTTREIARCLKMNYVFAVEFLELTLGQPHERHRLRRERGAANARGLHGNAILSRFPLRHPALLRLNGTAAYWRKGGFDGEHRLGERMALFAQLPVSRGAAQPPAWLQVVCTHLDAFIGERYNARAAEAIAAALRAREGDATAGAIVAGDFGSKGRSSAAADHLHRAEGFQPPGATNLPRSHEPRPRGDWVMVRGDHAASSLDVVSSRGASDHNFVRLDLRLRAPATLPALVELEPWPNATTRRPYMPRLLRGR